MPTTTIDEIHEQQQCAWCGKSNGITRWLKGGYCSEFCQLEGDAMSNEQPCDEACKVDVQGHKWSVCGAPADQPCICDVYVAALPDRIWLDLRDSPVSGKWRVYTAPNSFALVGYIRVETAMAELSQRDAEIAALRETIEVEREARAYKKYGGCTCMGHNECDFCKER